MGSQLLRAAAPAVALTGLALTAVALFDPALGAMATGSAAGAGTGGATGASAGAGPTACSSTREVTGDTVMTRFGAVQVSAEVDGSTLCSVAAIAWPQGDPKSAMINSYAIPLLDQQASVAGVDFDAVSGATYTSQGYRKSLQSIVDQL